MEGNDASFKYEEVYLQDYGDAEDALGSLKRYWRFYNQARRHQSLKYRTPAAVYFGEELGPERKRRRVAARV